MVTLAYFVMSAGSQHRNGLVLSLGKYTSSEQDIFRAMLLLNFGLATTVQSRGRIYVGAKDKARLRALILPYLHSSRLSLFDKPSPSK